MAEKTKEKTKLENKPEKKETIWTSEELQNSKTLYGCEILIENGTTDQVTTKEAPVDSYIVEYTYKDKICYDLTRGTKITFNSNLDLNNIDISKLFSNDSSISKKLYGNEKFIIREFCVLITYIE